MRPVGHMGALCARPASLQPRPDQLRTPAAAMATFAEAPAGDAAKGECWGLPEPTQCYGHGACSSRAAVRAPGFGFWRRGGRASHLRPQAPCGAPSSSGWSRCARTTRDEAAGCLTAAAAALPTSTLAASASLQLPGIPKLFVGAAPPSRAARRPPQLPPPHLPAAVALPRLLACSPAAVFCTCRRQDLQDQVRAVPHRGVWRGPQAGPQPGRPVRPAVGPGGGLQVRLQEQCRRTSCALQLVCRVACCCCSAYSRSSSGCCPCLPAYIYAKRLRAPPLTCRR